MNISQMIFKATLNFWVSGKKYLLRCQSQRFGDSGSYNQAVNANYRQFRGKKDKKILSGVKSASRQGRLSYISYMNSPTPGPARRQWGELLTHNIVKMLVWPPPLGNLAFCVRLTNCILKNTSIEYLVLSIKHHTQAL